MHQWGRMGGRRVAGQEPLAPHLALGLAPHRRRRLPGGSGAPGQRQARKGRRQRLEQGQGTWQEESAIARAARDEARKAKAQLELSLARDVQATRRASVSTQVPEGQQGETAARC